MDSPTAAPGWYASDAPGQQRWWDGQEWTDQVSQVSQPQQETPDRPRNAVAAAVGVPSPRPVTREGLYWGKGDPKVSLFVGIGFSVLGAGALLITLVFSLIFSLNLSAGAVLLMIFGLLFLALGVIAIIDASFGFKLRKPQQPSPSHR